MIMTKAIAIARTVANDDATATVANAPPNAISTTVAAAIAVINAVAAVTAVVNPIPAVTTVVATEATATAATTAFVQNVMIRKMLKLIFPHFTIYEKIKYQKQFYNKEKVKAK